MAGERDEGRDAPVEGRFSRASPEISFRGFTRCATDPEGNPLPDFDKLPTLFPESATVPRVDKTGSGESTQTQGGATAP